MVKINEKECDGCGTCVAVCPQCAILMPNIAVINHELCADCKVCVNVCPKAALE
jgi:ferredoxin